jgi:hypothetical protein
MRRDRGHHAADVEEAEAAFVLFVLLSGLLDDPGVEQRDRLAVVGADDRRGPVDADLRGRDAEAFAEGVYRCDPDGRRVEFGDHSPALRLRRAGRRAGLEW